MLRPMIASLLAALIMPPIILLALDWSILSSFTLYDWRLAYLFVGPFTLVGAFAVAWPSYALQRQDRSEVLKVLVSSLVCAIAGVLMLLPLSGRVPWEGAVSGAATFLLWLAVYRVGGLSTGSISKVRS